MEQDQAARQAGTSAHVEQKKRILIGIIAITLPLPLFFLNSQPMVSLTMMLVPAKAGSLTGMLLLVWQFLLGYRRGAAVLIEDLVWVVNLHKFLGKMAFFLILLHPLFISLYYLTQYGKNILSLDLRDRFYLFVFAGVTALLFLGLLVVTSIVVRRLLSTGWWYLFHLSSYIILPLILLHSFALGSTIRQTSLMYGWIALGAFVALLYVFRILFGLGILKYPYTITKATPVAERVIEIEMEPRRIALRPKIGQFIYFQRNLRHGSRPYTVSGYDEQSGRLSITAKASGLTSTALLSARPGERVGLDGPYGVFTWAAIEQKMPIVMIAGGIGITPFRRLSYYLESAGAPQCTLFYGNESGKDIVYKKELDSFRHLRVIHVLSDEPDYPGEKGLVTIGLLRKYLGENLSQHTFLLCGPPVMVMKLEAALSTASVPLLQIHHELFA